MNRKFLMPTWIYCDQCSCQVGVTGRPNERVACPKCGNSLQISQGCEVFVSYATSDLGMAQKVCEALSAQKINYWLAPEKVETGDSFLAAIMDGLQSTKLIAVILSRAASQSPWVKSEIVMAISCGTPVLPFRIEEFELPKDFRLLMVQSQWQNAYLGPVDQHVDRFVTRIKDKLRELAGNAVADAAAPIVLPQLLKNTAQGVRARESPYVGPRPFPAGMSGHFYGRQHDANAILRLMAASRALLIYAPSGAGKSSLLNTLILDSLQDQNLDVSVGIRVGSAISDRTVVSGIRNVFTYSVVAGIENTPTPNPCRSLRESLSLRKRRAGMRGRVLILDQFEELFTQHTEWFEHRQQFLADVVEALAADENLRVVFAMRQEYLADIDPLLPSIDGHFAVQRFALRRLDRTGALEAITGPASEFAEFAPGVAEEIVDQLNTVKIPTSDGTVITKPGEYIELVHLQIVCARLWDSLPEGINRIERDHLRLAAGEGQTFESFVGNALDGFFDAVVARVAESEKTRKHGGFSRDLIRLGCMKFVTSTATRIMIQEKNERAGRLPNWIVDQLEESHLFRFETRGGSKWYELSHDRLAEPVARQINHDVSDLLFASDLLNTVLNRILEERSGDLANYFEPHRDVLVECKAFHLHAGLFEDEVEFAFRTSLGAGIDTPAWSQRISQDFPLIQQKVLREALACSDEDVRANAAELLAGGCDAKMKFELLQLAMDDRVDRVRRAAVQSLVKLDDESLFRSLAERLEHSPENSDARRVWSQLLVHADRGYTGANFVRAFERIGPWRRVAIRIQAWVIRSRDTLTVLPFVLTPALVIAPPITALFKWIPGMFGHALCQARPSPIAGLFHGVTGAILWSGMIALFVMTYRVIFYRHTSHLWILRPIGALIWGAIGGSLAGLVLTLTVAGVFDRSSLVTMGWISSGDSGQFSSRFLEDIFLTTRFGWAYAITGCGMGVGMAIIANGMKASGKLLLEGSENSVTAWRDFLSIFWRMMKLGARSAYPFPICLAIAAAITLQLLRPGVGASPEKASFEGRLMGIFFDCGSQFVGGYFAMVSVGMGVVLMTRGVRVAGRKDQI